VVEKIRPTLLIVDVEGAENELLVGGSLPGVSKVVIELHERIIGREAVGQVRGALMAAGFQEDRGLSSREHLVVRR
jgi:hypothetical protein